MIPYCQYRYNPSEIYKRSKPGQGVETVCGAHTFPAQDVPEYITVADHNGKLKQIPTGNHVLRDSHDPYCPMHGGSPEPPKPPITYAEVQAAQAELQRLADDYRAQLGVAAAPAPVAITELEPSADTLAALQTSQQTLDALQVKDDANVQQ